MARAIALGESSKIRIDSFVDDKGNRHLNVRKMYKTKNSDTWMPAKQGISISEDLALRVLKAMKKELDEIEENAKPLPEREPRAQKGKAK